VDVRVRSTGAVGGSLLSGVVPGGGHVLMLATAALVGFTAYRTPSSAVVEVEREEHFDLWRSRSSVWLRAASGLLGIGGGI
jgi:hypothetical protein